MRIRQWLLRPEHGWREGDCVVSGGGAGQRPLPETRWGLGGARTGLPGFQLECTEVMEGAEDWLRTEVRTVKIQNVKRHSLKELSWRRFGTTG